MATVRKNTKEFNEVINTVKGWSVSCLSNCFIAEPIEEMKFDEFDLKYGKLSKEGSVYTFSIHSNLWYKLNVAA